MVNNFKKKKNVIKKKKIEFNKMAVVTVELA